MESQVHGAVGCARMDTSGLCHAESRTGFASSAIDSPPRYFEHSDRLTPSAETAQVDRFLSQNESGAKHGRARLGDAPLWLAYMLGSIAWLGWVIRRTPRCALLHVMIPTGQGMTSRQPICGRGRPPGGVMEQRQVKCALFCSTLSVARLLVITSFHVSVEIEERGSVVEKLYRDIALIAAVMHGLLKFHVGRYIWNGIAPVFIRHKLRGISCWLWLHWLLVAHFYLPPFGFWLLASCLKRESRLSPPGRDDDRVPAAGLEWLC